MEVNRINVLLLLCLANLVFWAVGSFYDIYTYAIAGVVFEFLWLPFLVLLFALPIYTGYLLIKQRFKSLLLITIFLLTLVPWVFNILKE